MSVVAGCWLLLFGPAIRCSVLAPVVGDSLVCDPSSRVRALPKKMLDLWAGWLAGRFFCFTLPCFSCLHAAPSLLIWGRFSFALYHLPGVVNC